MAGVATKSEIESVRYTVIGLAVLFLILGVALNNAEVLDGMCMRLFDHITFLIFLIFDSLLGLLDRVNQSFLPGF